MRPVDYHHLLLRQIHETLGDNAEVSDQIKELLQRVSDAYARFEQDRKTTESQVELRTSQLIASTSNAYSFLDSLNRGFIMCDINGEIVLTNLSVRHILSLKLATDGGPGSPTNNNVWTIDAVDSLLKPSLELKKLVLQCLETGLPTERKDVTFGKRMLQLFISPMVNQESKGERQQIGAVILVEDITQQKALERSKDEFLSMASHELRTPLTAIRGNAALIKQYYGDRLPDADVSEMVDDIHTSAIRLIEIVNDFLDASAIEQGKIIMNPEAFGIGDAIGQVIHELQPLCDSKGIALVYKSAAGGELVITADKQRIKQVLYNLIGNAVKFTDKGSITISTQADDHFVYTVVSDTGKGIPVEYHPYLFTKFQQTGTNFLTRDNTKGTGLGLYISKLLLELSGGKIKLAASETGKGSTFVFSLPKS